LFGTDPSTTTPSFEAFLSLIHPDDRQAAIDRVKAMENGGSTFDDDLRLIRPRGEMLWINSRAKTTFDHAGNLLYGEGTDQDITARKRAQYLLSIQHHVVER
jgi:PAS domain S-box-containing protein